MKNNNNKTSLLDDPEKQFQDRDLLHTLINHTDDMMWSVDRNYNVVISNQQFDKTYGHILGMKSKTEEGILATQLHFLSLYERAISGETFKEVEYTNTPEERWLEISYHPMRSGNEVTGVCCYSHDVTPSKKEINQLNLFESVVAHAADSILITEANPNNAAGPKIVYVNGAFLNLTGYALEEIIGKTPDILLGPNSDLEQIETLRKCFECSKSCEIEIINYKKNGGEFWVHMAMAPVADINGNFFHFITVGRDVTERLANIRSLQEQNLKLSEIGRLQSHDLRGPLARIQGLINLLTSYPESLERNSMDELLSYLKVSVKDMDVVIKKIITRTLETPVSGSNT